jgi:hypothetical protein
MEGTDRVRFCQSCAKNVYNLSAMSQSEAEQLITEAEGKLCVSFYRRADGTILTDNCSVGMKIVRRPFQWLLAGFIALLASGVAIFASEPGVCATTNTQTSGFGARVINTTLAFINRLQPRARENGGI